MGLIYKTRSIAAIIRQNRTKTMIINKIILNFEYLRRLSYWWWSIVAPRLSIEEVCIIDFCEDYNYEKIRKKSFINTFKITAVNEWSDWQDFIPVAGVDDLDRIVTCMTRLRFLFTDTKLILFFNCIDILYC